MIRSLSKDIFLLFSIFNIITISFSEFFSNLKAFFMHSLNRVAGRKFEFGYRLQRYFILIILESSSGILLYILTFFFVFILLSIYLLATNCQPFLFNG